MVHKILVAYASWAGATAEVAKTIAEELRRGGSEVEVQPAKAVKDIRPYQAVVLGTAVRAGKVNREAPAFVSRHRASLVHLPVAYFVVCLTMKDDTPESRETVEQYVDQVRQKAPQVEPVAVGMFAGAVNPSRLPWPLNLAMKSMEGDFRDWDQIRSWATDLLPVLLRA